MNDEGRRAENKQEDADKQSSEPKPISRKEPRKKWADLGGEEEQLQSQKEIIELEMVRKAKKAIMQLKIDKGWTTE